MPRTLPIAVVAVMTVGVGVSSAGALAGCGIEQAPEAGVDAGTGPPPTREPAPTPAPCGFDSGFSETATLWALPFAVEGVEDGGQIVRWRWVLADDDDRPDLLAIPEQNGVLEPRLVLWRNEGEGFATSAVSWEVGFVADSLEPGPDGPWGLIDVDGDGWLDVVDARGPGSIGGSTWSLLRGGPDGLTPGLWSIPFPTGPQLGDGEVAQWGVLDLDGDGTLDMVARQGDAADGVAAWSWWPGGISGFSPFERAWAVPIRLDALRDPAPQPSWRIVDLDGDGPLDLVVADAEDQTRWTVYRGTTSGFAGAGQPVALPRPLRHVADDRASPTWRLLDIDGDARLDFVTLGDESDRWSVHFGQIGPTGEFTFASAATPWRLGFDTDRVQDRSISPAWAVRDVDGDGVVDLLRTTDAPDRLAVHPGACAPVSP